MLSVKVITDFKGFQAISTSWDELAREHALLGAFGFSAYSLAWWKVLEPTHWLRIVVVTEGSKARLIAPFCAAKKNPGNWEFIGHEGADYCDLIVAPHDHQAVEKFCAWLKESKEWSRLSVENLPEHSPWLTQTSAGPLFSIQWSTHHPYIDASDLASHSKLLAGKNYRKHTNWFERQGTLHFSTERTVEAIHANLEEFIALHIKKWDSLGEKSFYTNERDHRLAGHLVSALAPHGFMRMDRLCLDGKLIAGHLGFEWKGKVYWYITCYDPKYDSHSPGKILLGTVLTEAAKSGMKGVELLRGREAYKDHYASGIHKTGVIKAYRGKLSALQSFVKGKLKGRVG